MITVESAGERILKIGQYLAKLWVRVECPVFFDLRGKLTTYYRWSLILSPSSSLSTNCISAAVTGPRALRMSPTVDARSQTSTGWSITTALIGTTETVGTQ